MSGKTEPCKACRSEVSRLGVARVLRKYDVHFGICPSCGFIQTESPYWLAEAYAEPFAKSDVGRVSRNLLFSRMTSTLIPFLCSARSQFLDYGGGDGLFVRLMRDRGYDFYWSDKHAENVFAAGFEAPPAGDFGLMTAFEVFEHLTDPAETIDEMLRRTETILFSTLVVPSPTPPLGEWWYYALDDGQHISFYTVRSLEALAGRFGLNLISDGSAIHLLGKRKFPRKLFTLLRSDRVTRLLQGILRRKSLLTEDYLRVTGHVLNGKQG